MNVDPIGGACLAALWMLAAAAALAVVRLARGPHLADRVMALDLLGAVAIAAMAVESVRTGEPPLLHVPVALALLLFASTVGFARAMSRRETS